MAAPQTKKHGKDTSKRTGMGERIRNKEKKKKGRKQGRKTRKSYSRRFHSNKSSGLCYKDETGTLSPRLPPSSCSRRQRYHIFKPSCDCSSGYSLVFFESSFG